MAIRNDLELTLDKVLENLEKQGIIKNLSPTDRKDLITKIANVIEDIRPDLDQKELLNPQFQKSLGLALMSQRLNDISPAFKNNPIEIKKLFDKKVENLPEREKELKNIFKRMLTELNKLHPENRRINEKGLDYLAERMARETMRDFKKSPDQKALMDNDSIVNTMGEVLSESLRNLYGGVDPRQTGGYKMPVLAIVGNYSGIADYSGEENATSNAFIDRLNSYQGTEDPLGIENQNLKRMEQTGGIMDQVVNGITAALESAFGAEQKSRFTPFNTQLKPPNSFE